MFTFETNRLRSRLPRLLLLLCLALALSFSALAQNEQDLAALIESLEETYRVLPSSDGYVLTPREDETGIDLVEIEAGQVAVNGEPRAPEQVQKLLGEDAGPILQLAARFAGPGGEAEAAELEKRLERLRELEEERKAQLEELRQIEETLEEVRGVERDEERDEERRQRRERHRRDTRMAFGNSLTIKENESSREVVVLGGSLEVLGEVRGDAVVVGGSAEVSGEITGDLTVVGGSIFLGPGAEVDGEVVSIGGPVESDPESFVRGGITELAMGPTFFLDDIDWEGGDWLGLLWPGNWFSFGWDDTFDLIGNAIFLAIIMMLIVLVARRPVERVAKRADREPWKSALVGLLVQILIGPVVFLLFVLLMVSVVGIPLAVLLLPVSLMVLILFFLLGYAGVAWVAGGWLESRFDWREINPYLAVLFGLVLIQGWSILGEALSFGSGPIHFTAMLLILLGFLLKYCVWTTGLGAVVLHSFSPDPETSTAAALPPSPPSPPSPSPTPSHREDVDGIVDSWRPGGVHDAAEWEEAARLAEKAAEEDGDGQAGDEGDSEHGEGEGAVAQDAEDGKNADAERDQDSK